MTSTPQTTFGVRQQREWLSKVRSTLHGGPWVTNALFAVVLIYLEKVVEKEFACPCDPEWNSWFVAGYFLVPAFLSFILSVPAQGCSRCLTGCCMCAKDVLTSLTPAFVWMLLLFFDGHYYACGMTDWSGSYATVNENAVEKWCEPANGTSSPDMLLRTQEWFVRSQQIGLNLVTTATVGITLYKIYRCCCCEAEAPSTVSEEGGGGS